MNIILASKSVNENEFLREFNNNFKNGKKPIEIIRMFTKDDVLDFIREKNADLLIIEEYLQEYLPVNIPFLNKIIKLSPHTKVIFIISDESKSNKIFLKDLYNLGIHNVLLENDANVKNILALILDGRDGESLKSYLGLDYDEETVFLDANVTDNKSEKNKKNYTKDTPHKTSLSHKSVYSQDKKEKVIKKEIIKHIYSVPRDYKKVIGVMGFESSGATTLAVNLAYLFSKKKIKTTLIDTDYKRKDVYYHFNEEFLGCLSEVNNNKDLCDLGQAINKYLTIFTEHKDVKFEINKDSLFKLLANAKKNSDVVIIDLSRNLDDETIKRTLEFLDNTLIVTNQNINKLYRHSKMISKFNENINSAQLVINKYIDGVAYLDGKNIRKNFFKGVDINKTFVIKNDLKSIILGLTSRTPAVDIKNNLLSENLKEIIEFYYKKSSKKTNLFKRIYNLLKK